MESTLRKISINLQIYLILIHIFSPLWTSLSFISICFKIIALDFCNSFPRVRFWLIISKQILSENNKIICWNFMQSSKIISNVAVCALCILRKSCTAVQMYTCWLELILILYKAHWTPIMSNKNYFISSNSQICSWESYNKEKLLNMMIW